MANHFIKLDIEGLYNTLQPIKANYEAIKKYKNKLNKI